MKTIWFRSQQAILEISPSNYLGGVMPTNAGTQSRTVITHLAALSPLTQLAYSKMVAYI